MLQKLIKYDLKSMLKTMFPLWIALLAVSVLFGIRLFFTGPDSDSIFMSGENSVSIMLLTLLLFGVFVAVFVLNIILVIQRFWNGLLKDEGYLMFTLPVSTRSLIISKALSAVIIYIISALVAAVCFILIVGFGFTASRHNLGFFWFVDVWKEGINQLSQIFSGRILSLIGWILYWIITGLTELLENIYHAYTAMAIGQLSNKNRFLSSIIAYLGLSFAVSTAVSVPLFTFGAIGNTEALAPHWFTVSQGFPSVPVLIISLMVNILLVVIYHVVTEFLLTKNLNLE